MITLTYRCSKEVKSVIEETFKMKETDQLTSNSILILEATSVKDLKVDKKEDLTIVVIISDGDLIFEILDLKPAAILRKQHLEKDLNLLKEVIEDKKKHFSRIIEFKSGYLTIRLNVTTIIYIESFGHYLQIHTTSGKFMVRDKLSAVLKRLEGFNFSQIHKSFIVNMNFVKMINNKVCILKDDTQLTVGRAYQQK